MTTSTEWEAFAALAGHGSLLPAASTGIPSAQSRVSPKMIGKVPSLYNREGTIGGFKGWSTHISSPRQVKNWAMDERYNICVITGRPLPAHPTARLYAIDVDSEHENIQNIVIGSLPDLSAVRTRADSKRQLLLVAIEGTPIPKRVLRLRDEAGVVEFLGDGQQFIAAGRHPKGQQYVWIADPFFDPSPCLPDRVPVLTRDAFDAWWINLVATLPVELVVESGTRHDHVRGGEWCTDATADWLDANGHTISTGSDGRRYIRSPREAMYTEVSETGVCYFPAGSNKYERGHFVSLHASDADMNDDDWLDAFGIGLRSQFPEDEPVRQQFKRDKQGKVEASLLSLSIALADPDICGYTFRWDELAHTIEVRDRSGALMPLNDALPIKIAVELERDHGFKKVNKGNVSDAMLQVAWENRFDSAQDWLMGLQWDGKQRVETFFTDLWRIEDSDYVRATARYMWTAMAGRVMHPGVKADMAVMLISQVQGKQKSSTLAALVPHDDWFCAMDFGLAAGERAKAMSGKVLIELEELQGFSRREVTEVRTFLSATKDSFRLAYDKYFTESARRCFFVATTNEVTPLNDPAGNRRWLPLLIDNEFDAVSHDVVGRAKAIRDQLWAEALVMWRSSGVMWEEAERLCRTGGVADTFAERDIELEADIQRWLNSERLDGAGFNSDREIITTEVIVKGLFGSVTVNQHQLQMRVGKSLKRMGWVKVRRVIGAQRYWCYQKIHL